LTHIKELSYINVPFILYIDVIGAFRGPGCRLSHLLPNLCKYLADSIDIYVTNI